MAKPDIQGGENSENINPLTERALSANNERAAAVEATPPCKLSRKRIRRVPVASPIRESHSSSSSTQVGNINALEETALLKQNLSVCFKRISSLEAALKVDRRLIMALESNLFALQNRLNVKGMAPPSRPPNSNYASRQVPSSSEVRLRYGLFMERMMDSSNLGILENPPPPPLPSSSGGDEPGPFE